MTISIGARRISRVVGSFAHTYTPLNFPSNAAASALPRIENPKASTERVRPLIISVISSSCPSLLNDPFESRFLQRVYVHPAFQLKIGPYGTAPAIRGFLRSRTAAQLPPEVDSSTRLANPCHPVRPTFSRNGRPRHRVVAFAAEDYRLGSPTVPNRTAGRPARPCGIGGAALFA
jgi:hypothetical protein